MKVVKRIVLSMLMSATLISTLSGCNTTAGMGRDISAAGHTITRVASR